MYQQPKYVTTRQFTQKLNRERSNESRINGLTHFTRGVDFMKAQHQREENVESRRRVRRFKQQNDELLTGYALDQQNRDLAQQKMLREQDERMAAAMYDLKQQKDSEEQNVRRICEESEELKTLKEKLTQAKISKVRSTQLKERALLDRQEEAKQAQMDAAYEEDRRAAVEAEYEESQRKLHLNVQSKRVLQHQIAAREVKKAEAHEAFLREKAMVDEIVRGIEAEDRAKAAEGRRVQREMQLNIDDYLAQRKVWREAERARAEEELRRIEEYNDQKRRQHEKLMNQKRREKDGADEILRKLTREIEQKRREEDEMRQLLDELYQEEAEQKAIEKMKADQKKKDDMKEEMMEANEYQKRLKHQRAEEEHAEEQRFRAEMMARFEEDRRLDQMNKEARYQQRLQFVAEVDRLVEERREQYRKSVEAEFEAMRIQEEQEKFRAAVVERERQRLLREHAKALSGYLPKGVILNEDDYRTVHNREAAEVTAARSPIGRMNNVFNPITGRAERPQTVNPTRTPSRSNIRVDPSQGRAGTALPGRRVGVASPNSRDSLDNFAIGQMGNGNGSNSRSNSRQPSQQQSRPPSSSRRRPPSQYAYKPDQGPSDRPF